MRIVIRRKEDGGFLCADSTWTYRPEEALDFDNTTKAQNYCCEHGLKEVEILVQYKDVFQVAVSCP